MKEKNQREYFFTQVIGQSSASSPGHAGLHAENWEWPGDEAGQD